MNNNDTTRRPLALSMVITGALVRLLPHLPNFAPVGGLSLFAGARLRGWQAYCIPVAILAVTDPIMGRILGYTPYTLVTPFVFGSFMINVWIGSYLRRTEKAWQVGAAALLCSSQFFLISNFGMWAVGGAFPLDLSGLLACYITALPYFGRTIASDLLYTGVLFGLHSGLTRVAFPRERVADQAGGLS